MIKENEFLPADVLILNTSEKKGACFVETKNLDGETNLKIRGASMDVLKIYPSLSELSKPEVQFEFEPPNPYLYSFNGKIIANNEEYPLNANNFILRGCSLRNTKWIYAVVAYSGHDTKIMLNSVKAKAKNSQVFKAMNIYIIAIFFVQIVFCVLCSLLHAIYYNLKEDELSYLEVSSDDIEDSTWLMIIVKIGAWVILFTNFVPISLIVTLEMVKFLQGKIIQKDKNCCSSSGIWASVQTSSLNEELGQVEYIFSDKTGTLTQNFMEFKNLSIGGECYGNNQDYDVSSMKKVTNVDFKDRKFFEHLNDKNHHNYSNIKEFLLELAICHTVLTEEKQGEIIFNASSPDELALLNFAKFVGCEYQGTDDNNNILINFMGELLTYKLLHILEFNSTRKRMSIIVQAPSGQIILYCKGADSIILDRKSSSVNQTLVNQFSDHLQEFGSIGLRTLLLAKRVISKEIFTEWEKEYKQALTSLENRDEKMWKLQEDLEIKLELVGATAIEDKLQDDVGPTIATLKEAGIQIWVLTGDKIETAINIGYSCKLLSPELDNIIVDGKNEEAVAQSLQAAYTSMESGINFAFIISGDALISTAKSQQLTANVMFIAERAKAVIACRVSPKQKQEVVSLVRAYKPQVITLAIGDGANDVNMITAAHVGIGIRGVEGQQAARASDYAIGEFKILKRLVLYVGRESYRKNTNLICYNFYKNMAYVLPSFWIGFVSLFSGQLIIDPLLFQFFNMFYTALPIIVYALFDEEFPNTNVLDIFEAPQNFLEVNPKYYDLSKNSRLFNKLEFWLSIFNGAWHAMLIVTIASLSYENFDNEGKVWSLRVIGMFVFTSIVIITNLKILTFTNTSYPFSLIILYGSIIFYFGTYVIASNWQLFDCYNTFERVFYCALFWLGEILTVAVAILIDIGCARFKGFNQGQSTAKISDISQFVGKDYVQLKNKVEEETPEGDLDSSQKILTDKKKNQNQNIERQSSIHHGFAFSIDEKIDNFKIKHHKN